MCIRLIKVLSALVITFLVGHISNSFAVVTSSTNFINGSVVTDIDGALNIGHRLTVGADGKITTVTTTTYTSQSTTNNRVDLIRYNSDGSLDNTFGEGGILKTELVPLTATEVFPSLATQSDGKLIVAVGYRNDGLRSSLTRFNADGTLDASFSNGEVISHSDFRSRAVTLQQDGKILVAGDGLIAPTSNFCPSEHMWCSDTTYGVKRYLASGVADSGFGNNGLLIGDPIKQYSSCWNYKGIPICNAFLATFIPHGIVTSGSDNFTVVGTTYYKNVNYPNEDQTTSVLYRKRLTGEKDIGFNSTGSYEVFTDLPSRAEYNKVYSAISLPDNSVIACGQRTTTYDPYLSTSFFLIKLNDSGQLDLSFGTGGVVETKFSDVADYQATCYGLLLQSDGKIIAIGNSNDSNSGSRISLSRYNIDGSLDKSFGDDGKTNLKLSNGHDSAFNGSINSAGVLYITGTSGDNVSITRLTKNGNPYPEPNNSADYVTVQIEKIYPKVSKSGQIISPPSANTNPPPSQSICYGNQNVICLYSFSKNTSLDLYATPSSGLRFLGWDDDCAGINQTCNVTLSRNTRITATFLEDTPSDPTKPILRDAVYMYNKPLYAISEKQVNGHNCDILELVLDVTTGYTDLSMTTSVPLGNGVNYPDRITADAPMFVYTLYGNSPEKRFTLRSNSATDDSNIGTATFFGYCYSVQTNATVDVYDGKTGVTQ